MTPEKQIQVIEITKKEVVGAVGFEPTTSCSQGRRANQAALRPDSIEKGSI